MRKKSSCKIAVIIAVLLLVSTYHVATAQDPTYDEVAAKFAGTTVEAWESYQTQFDFCIDAAAAGLPPELGGVGYVATDPAQIQDFVVDPLVPESLLLNRDGDVLGVAYTVPDRNHGHPELFGQRFEIVPAHQQMSEDYYELHVWFVGTPERRFSFFHPGISCPSGDFEALPTPTPAPTATADAEGAAVAEKKDPTSPKFAPFVTAGALGLVAGIALLLPFGKEAPTRALILTWLAWALILLAFQFWADARFDPKRPDYAVNWTPEETQRRELRGRPYLNDPVMNHQVAWDSEYYLSIATLGSYDDPDVLHDPQSGLALNYAFMPFYPLMIRLVRLPLLLFNFSPTGTSTIAGIIVSAVGTLMAMLSLYDLTRDELDPEGARRAAFYLLIYPAGFFLLQVYTEGLFVGLAFTALALTRRKQYLWAGLLACCATLTRSVGIALMVPLALAWLQEAREQELTFKPFPWRMTLNALIIVLPALVYLIWSGSQWGQAFETVQTNYFWRRPLAIAQSVGAWGYALTSSFEGNNQQLAYYLIEFAAILFTPLACLLTARRYPGLSAFGALVWFVSLTSGAAQGMHRYVLAAPSLFIVLARWGRHEVFDRAWTLASTLIMGIMAALYSFNFWTG